MVRTSEIGAPSANHWRAEAMSKRFRLRTADEVVDKALAYVFAKDRDFQDFLRTPEAAHVPPSLRVRHFGQNGAAREAVNGAAKRPNGSVAAHDPVPTKRAAGAE